ncbi:SDR family NAD(P)-dependent oxidoreductase [Streptomyces sp. DSM 41921]|uniref:SDR family NAD(P)-dependent oxidoreductase n=1 Tax=Streptomyces dubilierae TaxID=3075533 RepID=A0ABU2P2X6_9ACTN|nr:SDR family NAD(P)-dependent oxidoreductase [Streptomyces sp. DSM 41921]MDT0385999.1 SDR family NAD(P)-dependent oxidoreductase [Streptomyces sp. DSM 41921]
MQFDNQTALVTGSTSGIGRETALLLAGHGASVIVSGRNALKGAETVAAIRRPVARPGSSPPTSATWTRCDASPRSPRTSTYW